MAHYDEINTPVVAVVGIISVILTVAVVLLLVVVFYQFEAGQQQSDEFTRPPSEIANLQADQLGKLNQYRILDPEKRTVAIPIGRAMELVVEELSKQEKEAKEVEDES